MTKSGRYNNKVFDMVVPNGCRWSFCDGKLYKNPNQYVTISSNYLRNEMFRFIDEYEPEKMHHTATQIMKMK
ncbi:12447_t:CDS:2 [Funneliformis caledonium]|uniref:12447_t:CDS:1 n=1 Tax=Funneliformis caledonium TaxID=1117310 RepID=A0A9N9B0E6_9GLOM|nr:12447_t:CDS:2 [Funneliformis caledonium]